MHSITPLTLHCLHSHTVTPIVVSLSPHPHPNSSDSGFDPIKMSSNANQADPVDSCNVTGFACLNWLVPLHSEVCELYVILFSLLLSRNLNKQALQVCSNCRVSFFFVYWRCNFTYISS